MKAKSKLIALCATVCITALALAGCSSSGDKEPADGDANSSGSSAPKSEPVAEPEAPAEITFDVPFEFDGLTITFGSDVQAATLENQFSDLDGTTVAAIPISVTNNSDETKGLNMFYYKAFGPSGTELDDVSSYFMEADIAFAGDARPGATIEATLDIPYEGSGDYYIAFDNFKEKIEVKLPISL